MAKALDLTDGIKPVAVLANRGYDADRLSNPGATPVSCQGFIGSISTSATKQATKSIVATRAAPGDPVR
jgi:hypothetical protein